MFLVKKQNSGQCAQDAFLDSVYMIKCAYLDRKNTLPKFFRRVPYYHVDLANNISIIIVMTLSSFASAY